MKKKLFGIVILVGICASTLGQCSYFPADCPETGDIEAAQDSTVSLTNLVVPQEIAMQNRLRGQFKQIMDGIAKNKDWQVYEYTESTGGGIGMNGNAKALTYELRRPHEYTISFIFIVNDDSLKAWQHWYNNDLQNASQNAVDAFRQSGTTVSGDDTRQKYIDSSTYYSDLKAKYMTDHMDAYQKALLSGDKKGQKKFEDENKKYDDKINGFVNIISDKNAASSENSSSKVKDLELYKSKNTIAFRNASILRVTLSVNQSMITADDADKKIIKQISLPGTTLGLLMHNPNVNEHEIFGQYYRSPDVAMLLFGKWILKQDQYHDYHTSFSLDKSNTDVTTPKKTLSDRVQTLAMYVEGSVSYINQFLKSIDGEEINNLIAKL